MFKGPGPGRPPKERSFAAALRVAINEAVEGGGNKLRKVAEALVDKAMSGDVNAIRELADRIDGKVPQALVGEDDGPVRVAHSLDLSDLEPETREIIRALVIRRSQSSAGGDAQGT